MVTRRSFLRTIISSLTLGTAGTIISCRHSKNNGITPYKHVDTDSENILLPADENGLMLPDGYTSRIIAKTGETPYSGSAYTWHGSPDGGATFETDNGGWIYVSNSELDNNQGGVGAIQFDTSGNVIQAYSILDNTSRNCAGGTTPWKTWLSCEEIETGTVWECDPYGQLLPIQRKALGTFNHESLTVDTNSSIIYMTEDKTDGCLYRFIADSFDSSGYPRLISGTLQAAELDSKTSIISWITVPDPDATSLPTRYQVPSSKPFNGGEGIVYIDGFIYFATKGDDRIWKLNTITNKLSVYYDAKIYIDPILTNVDGMTVSPKDEVVVSEDGGNMQIVAITKTGKFNPIVQIVGHDRSEVTGPAFSPDGQRLYFSSQRGSVGNSSSGITYEVTGPFLT